MPYDTSLQSKQYSSRKLFEADEIGWIAADASVEAARGGVAALTGLARLGGGLAKLAAHPRLTAAAGETGLGIADAAFWPRWDGSAPLLAAPGAVNLVVFLGWRGAVTGADGSKIDAEPGHVLRLDAGGLAALARADSGDVGPLLVLSYAADGVRLAPVADDALWPPAWVSAG